jgi:hypothetical protein
MSQRHKHLHGEEGKFVWFYLVSWAWGHHLGHDQAQGQAWDEKT